jgi:hypothetical protein
MKLVLRRLVHLPVFATVVLLTLAIGIGANAAIFSVIQGVLLKPLPFPPPDELVVVDHTAPGVNIKNAGAAAFLYFTYRESASSLYERRPVVMVSENLAREWWKDPRAALGKRVRESLKPRGVKSSASWATSAPTD